MEINLDTVRDPYAVVQEMESMRKKCYLMLRNIEVMEMNLAVGYYKPLAENLMPYGIREKLLESNVIVEREPILTTGRDYNRKEVDYWLSQRILLLSRKHAKKILNAFKLSQAQDSGSRAKVALVCRALSLKDDYWIKWEGEDARFENLCLRDASLGKAMAQTALKGTSITIRGKIEPQDITTVGSYAKTWVREKDGVYLYKAGSNLGGFESRVEVSVSGILDSFNVKHLKYELVDFEGITCCKCRCLSNDTHSVVHADEVEGYINRKGGKLISFVEGDKRFAEDFHKMNVVDYVVGNEDRHGQNWGFYMGNKSGDLTMLHPLYDHNNAFGEENIDDIEGGASIIMSGHSKFEVAKYSIRKCDLRLVEDIKKSVFVNGKHMEMLCRRMDKLGIKFKWSKFAGIKVI
jgi:hypothetical protein